jgi:hypothetical protein
MRTEHLSMIAAVSLFLGACGNVEKVGTGSHAPLPATAEVALFTEEGQVKQPFDVIGKISYGDPGKFQNLSLKDTFEPLKARAREIGANGVIIDKSDTIVSGIFSRGITVEARAIRLQAPPTTVAPAGAGGDPVETLRQLRKLHDDGTISDSEFERKKAEILRRM